MKILLLTLSLSLFLCIENVKADTSIVLYSPSEAMMLQQSLTTISENLDSSSLEISELSERAIQIYNRIVDTNIAFKVHNLRLALYKLRLLDANVAVDDMVPSFLQDAPDTLAIEDTIMELIFRIEKLQNDSNSEVVFSRYLNDIQKEYLKLEISYVKLSLRSLLTKEGILITEPNWYQSPMKEILVALEPKLEAAFHLSDRLRILFQHVMNNP